MTRRRSVVPALAIIVLMVLMTLIVRLPPVNADTEPNDDFLTAEWITPGTYSGGLNATDTVDVYKMTVPAAGDEVYANVTVPATMALTLNVYGEDLGLRAQDSVTDGVARVDHVFATAQTVYVQLLATSGDGGYSLEASIRRQDDAGSGGDAGDGPLSATPTSAGTFSGFLKDEDTEDFYTLTLHRQGDSLYLDAVIPATLSATVSVYGEDSGLRARASGTGTTLHLSHVFLPAQQVTFDVAAAAGYGTYQVTAEVVSQDDAGSGRDAGNDAATSLPLTSGTYTAFLGGEDTDDVYQLTLSDIGQRVYVNVSLSSATTASVTLAAQDQGVRAQASGTATVLRIDYVFSVAENPYVFVHLDGGTGGSYGLEAAVRYQNDAGSGGDASGSQPDALPLTVGTYTGLLKDADLVDMYKVAVGAGQTLCVNATVGATFHIAVSLFNAGWDQLAYESVYGGTAHAQTSVINAQTIWIEVYTEYGTSVAEVYTLEVKIPGADTTPPTIVHTAVALADQGIPIWITATVTDDFAVDSVRLDITNVAGTRLNLTMSKNGNTYTYEIPGQPTAGTVSYSLWAVDTSGNGAGTPTYTITIRGPPPHTTPPAIAHAPVNTHTEGQAITITANITDDVGVANATLYYRVKGTTTWTHVAMTYSGGVYTATIPAASVTTAGIEYYVESWDTAGNKATFPATNPTTAPQVVTVTAASTGAPTNELPWIWILVGIVLVAGVALVAVALLRRKKTPTPRSDEEESREKT